MHLNSTPTTYKATTKLKLELKLKPTKFQHVTQKKKKRHLNYQVLCTCIVFSKGIHK